MGPKKIVNKNIQLDESRDMISLWTFLLVAFTHFNGMMTQFPVTETNPSLLIELKRDNFPFSLCLYLAHLTMQTHQTRLSDLNRISS